MNIIITNLALAAICILTSGCYITQNPFADINKQGTVIAPDQSVTIQGEIGLVTIEYVAPTKRRIILNGESREFKLKKGMQHGGVFAETKFKQGPFEDIYGVKYGEGTAVFRSEADLKKYLHQYVNEFGFEHRADNQMIVQCVVREVSVGFFRREKYFFIRISKYQISDPGDDKPL